MIRMRSQTISRPASYRLEPQGAWGKAIYTAGNLLMLIGFYLLLYVGGLFADEQYNLMAALGDSDIVPVERAVVSSPAPRAGLGAPREQPPAVIPSADEDQATPAAEATVAPTTAPTPVESRPFRMPELNNPGGGRELTTLAPAVAAGFGPSRLERIQIPSIDVDRKVEEVFWTTEVVDGREVAVWEVSKYMVGHHTGTANPGQGGNIVLAGHSGGRAYPFNDIFYLKPGDQIILWSQGQQYSYSVAENLLLDEVGPNVTMEQRMSNARYIGPFEYEVVTLVTCWPLSGPDKFNQRVVIRAVPNRPTEPAASALPPGGPIGGWTIR